jgi:nitroreductase
VTNNQLYEAIFYRKSIRRFIMAPLSASILNDLEKFTGEIRPMDETIRYSFSVLGPEDVKNTFPLKAPHFLLLYSEKKGNYLMNAGFLLQQIDLYLSANHLGSCWLGIAKPAKQDQTKEKDMEFVILLAFGQTNEVRHRADISEFKRNSLPSITDLAGMNEILEPVRLAPSSVNAQPWFFSGSADKITVSRRKLNLIKAPIYRKLNQIDIGIALCHLWLSLDHLGKEAVFDFEEMPVPAGYEFMANVSTVR